MNPRPTWVEALPDGWRADLSARPRDRHIALGILGLAAVWTALSCGGALALRGDGGAAWCSLALSPLLWLLGAAMAVEGLTRRELRLQGGHLRETVHRPWGRRVDEVELAGLEVEGSHAFSGKGATTCWLRLYAPGQAKARFTVVLPGGLALAERAGAVAELSWMVDSLAPLCAGRRVGRG